MSGFGMDGWPTICAPTEEDCSLCGSSLSGLRPHRGQKTGNSGILITNAVPFEAVSIQVKQCSECSAMHQVFPFELGKKC